MARVRGYELNNAIGHSRMKIHHIGIHVNNLEESEKFYKEMFGFKVEHRLTILSEKITFMTTRDESIRIELIKEETVLPVEGTNHLAWEVKRIEHMTGKLASRGLFPIEGPFELDNGWKTVFYLGPNLEIIELIEI
jgi:lactoylglutathione lyase